MDEQEIKAITPEIMQTVKVSDNKVVPRDAKGRLLPGNPYGGRPKGSLNRFTKLRNDIADVFKAVGGKERLIAIAKKSDREFLQVVDRIISVLPKETKLDIQAEIGPKVVIIREQSNKGEKDGTS